MAVLTEPQPRDVTERELQWHRDEQQAPLVQPTGGFTASLLRTHHDLAVTILRLTLAIMILPHGAQKVFGWFGGHGFAGTMGFFTETMGIPWIFALAAILAESVGGLALLIGAFGRLAAFAVGTVMLVATLTVHLPYGFFMNWQGTNAGEGFEFHLLAIGIALALMIKGSGAWSVDRWLTRKLEQPPSLS